MSRLVGAAIGDGFDNTHLSNAVLEIGILGGASIAR
jgi:hypothetical protein